MALFSVNRFPKKLNVQLMHQYVPSKVQQNPQNSQGSKYNNIIQVAMANEMTKKHSSTKTNYLVQNTIFLKT